MGVRRAPGGEIGPNRLASRGAESLLASEGVPGLAGVVIQRAIRAAELAGQLAQWGWE